MRRTLNVDLDIHPARDGHWSLYAIPQQLLRLCPIISPTAMQGMTLWNWLYWKPRRKVMPKEAARPITTETRPASVSKTRA